MALGNSFIGDIWDVSRLKIFYAAEGHASAIDAIGALKPKRVDVDDDITASVSFDG